MEYHSTYSVNTLKPRPNGHHFVVGILKCIFLNEIWVFSSKILLKFTPKNSINNFPALAQNGLAPNWQQSIIWAKDSLAYWPIHASPSLNELTHCDWVMHICISKLTTIGSDNGLSPGRRQAIIWTNAGILLIGPLVTNFSEISIKIYTLSFKKMHLKILETGGHFVSASMC